MQLLIKAPASRCFAADGHSAVVSNGKQENRPLDILPTCDFLYTVLMWFAYNVVFQLCVLPFGVNATERSILAANVQHGICIGRFDHAYHHNSCRCPSRQASRCRWLRCQVERGVSIGEAARRSSSYFYEMKISTY